MSGSLDYASPALPVELVAQMLMHIEQQQRIQSCSLVNHAWRNAVHLTLKGLVCSLGHVTQYQSLCSWFSNNSSISFIESIEAKSRLPLWRNKDITALPTLQLPIQHLHRLQALRLQLCRLQPLHTAEASSTADQEEATIPWSVLSNLTELRLEYCIVDLGGLGSCKALQYLHLALPSLPSEAATAVVDGPPTAQEAALAAVLPDLKHLTYLWLNKQVQEDVRPLALEAFGSALSNLQQLKVLGLGQFVEITEPGLANLPDSLRTLNSRDPQWCVALTPEGTPRLQQLTNLQELQLYMEPNFNPQLLFTYPQLKLLEVDNIRHEEEEDILNLLSVLGELQQLRHLSLRDSLCCDVYDMTPFAALTASSNLTFLDLLGCDLRPGAAQVLFSPEQPCRDLLKLITCSKIFALPRSFQLLVSCCPALQHLAVESENGLCDTDLEGVSELQALSALTCLVFCGVNFSDDAMLSISRCQQLQHLGLAVAGISYTGLAHLTQLTALTNLSYSSFDWGDPRGLDLKNQATADCPPDVHHQLIKYLRYWTNWSG